MAHRPGLRRKGRIGCLLAAPLLAGLLAAAPARASTIDIGYVSYDVTSPGSTAQFDIVNITGPNSTALGDPSFPVTTLMSLIDLSLTVTFSNSTSEVFGASYFTTNLDGESLDGTTIATGGSNPQPTKAVLTGMFSPLTITGTGGLGTVTINPTFSSKITDSLGDLEDGDLALIVATTSAGRKVPEPAGLAMFLLGLASLAMLRVRALPPGNPRPRRRIGLLAAPLLLAATALGAGPALAGAAPVSVGLTIGASPSSGVAGVTYVNLTAATLPAGTILPPSVNVMLAPTCGVGATVAGEITTVAYSIKPVPLTHSSRIQFEIPPTTPQGTYYVWITGQTTASARFASHNCSLLAVTHSSRTLNACVPSSSMAVALGTKVTAYVPNGYWSGGTTGVEAVPIEGGGTPTAISTPNVVNSCSSNPATGQTICTANNTDVYLINGTTLTTTLTSGSNAYTGFSGGSCENCGVAVNALADTAYIAEGYSDDATSTSAIQPLSLTTNTFAPPFPLAHEISEDISIDPTRGLILSPDEQGVYDLIEINSAGQIVGNGEIANNFGDSGTYYFDSAAEDCGTGIALASDEFTDNVYITDLTQMSMPTTGTWTAPGQLVNFPEFAGFIGAEAGTDGIAVAPGSSHLGVVAGEYGGNLVGVLQLPATSGHGTPAFVDDVLLTLPPTPDGDAFQLGYDPHTTTAYTSPNDGRAYALVASWATGQGGYIAKIDLAKALAATRSAPHVTTVDLIANGIVTYIKATP